jgi:hypothetical protein
MNKRLQTKKHKKDTFHQDQMLQWVAKSVIMQQNFSPSDIANLMHFDEGNTFISAERWHMQHLCMEDIL